ncbi:MAG: PQQ-binding-like beta-propeller repeat protein, partial [Anaerolineaceae bacterium]
KFDLNGTETWSKYFGGSGINYMQIANNQVQVFTSSDKLIILNSQDGEVVKRSSYNNPVFLFTPTITFEEKAGLQAIDNLSNTDLWHVRLDHEIITSPTFLIDRIYIKTGQILGSVYSIDRATGDILWKTADNIVSNIAYSESLKKIYLLTRNGQLLNIDWDNGQQVVSAEISSTPFVLNGEEIVGGYELAFDDINQILFVLLGDSRQLFAFQIIK